jgi:nucleotide-binding universal stress UspA family protein
MYKRILVPLDGSDLAEEALPHAMAQASCFHAEVILLKVLELFPKDRRLSSAIVREAYELTAKIAEDYLLQVAVRLREENIPVQVVTVEGRPHEEIIDYAEANNVDLIVMGARGQSGVARWLMGSVADRVARGANIPVLLIHSNEGKGR